LRKISASTIDRLLKKTKANMKIKGTSGTMPNPFKLVQRSGLIRPKNPVIPDQETLIYPGGARRLFKNINARKYFVNKNNFQHNIL
jgi:hypothetical protein